MKKVLSFKEPIISSTIHQAIIFSVLPTQEKCIPWLINNYVSLFCLKNLYKQAFNRRGSVDFFYSLYGDWSMFEFSANPWLEYEAMDFSTIVENKISFIPFLEHSLNENKYLHVSIDWFYIPIYDTYKYSHGLHHLFINGYDSEKKVFYVHDTYKNGKYAAAEVHYDDLERGFTSLIDRPDTANSWEIGIFMFKIGMRNWHKVHSDLYTFNPKLLTYFLEDYLKGRANGFAGDDFQNFCFGIECYNELILFVQKALEGSIDKIDFRGFCNMLDHKKVMLYRLKWLTEHTNQNFSDEGEALQQIIKSLEIIIFKTIKWNLTGNNIVIKNVPTTFESIKVQEHTLLKSCIDKLKNVSSYLS